VFFYFYGNTGLFNNKTYTKGNIMKIVKLQLETRTYLMLCLCGFILHFAPAFLLGQGNNPKKTNFDKSEYNGLLASTFLGGSNTDDDYEPSIAVDKYGNIYITGYTHSADFPTTAGAYNENFNGGGTDRFVAKFDPDLQNMLASTYIGGSGNEYGMGLGVTDNGVVYVAGYTTSPDFPVTPDSYDETYNGGRDVFVLALDSNLTTLISSSYLGGSGDEGYQWPRIDLVVDSGNNIYIAGITKSSNFPFTPGAFDSTYAGGSNGGDAFISKFDAGLTTLLGSTFLGGNMDEWRVSVVLDENQNIYVCGETSSSNFPTTPNAFDQGFNGGSDVFISKFTNGLDSLLSSTFMGSNSYEEALSIKLDNNENVFIAGYTMSSTFPTTSNVYDPDYNGGERDAYVAKFNNGLTSLLASTFIGGNNKDTGEDIAIDENGNVYFTGVTQSSNFPVTPNAYNENFNGAVDIFISKFDSNLSILMASTYAGGSGSEKGQAIVLDKNNNVYIDGQTASIDFPVTLNAFDTTYNGGSNDCFIMKFDSSLSAIPTSLEEFEKHPKTLNVSPNPFNQSVEIKYRLNETSKVILKIYNLHGQEIRKLSYGFQHAGDKSIAWDGKDSNNMEVPSGIYFCSFDIKNTITIKKIIKN